MTEEEKQAEEVARVRPWAGCLHFMRHAVATKELAQVPLGELLHAACARYGVEYPPEDIASTILKLSAQWAMQDLPVPVDEGV